MPLKMAAIQQTNGKVIIRFFLIVSFVRYANSSGNWDRHPSWNLLNQNVCGISVADRIIGGTAAALGQFPWIAQLGYLDNSTFVTSTNKEDNDNKTLVTSTNKEEDDVFDDDIEWMCGGVLLTDRHVLTAAHCITLSGFSILKVVRLGEYDKTTNPDCVRGVVCAPPVQDIAIQKVTAHEKFNNYHFDVAILYLSRPVELNDYVSPICLPRFAQAEDLKEGEMLMVAGWGKTNMSTEAFATKLQTVQVPLLQPERCNAINRRLYAISPGELCAGAQKNKDACVGDSGGPLMKVYDTEEGPKTYAVGVVSFGPTICGSKTKPAVYTSVPHYMKWILDQLLPKLAG